MDSIATDAIKDLAGSVLGDQWADFLLKDFKVSIAKDTVAYVQAILGGAFLNFIPDDYNAALHSQPETWQRAFGYNELYDLVFETGSNMDRMHYDTLDSEYRLWLWKGDYWNLRSGAEVGLYMKDNQLSQNTMTPIFDCIDFEIPMQVSLYNYDKHKKCFTDNVFNWFPNQNQWWGTGFNWHYQDPDKDDMFVIGVVDLSQYEEIYQGFKTRKIKSKSLLFDDHANKIWISWYDENVNSSY